MLLWTAISLMTGAAILAVLWPLRAGGGTAPAASAADLAVYRDQLSEIERDRVSGLIGASEGEAARAEVGRRILRASAETASGAARPSGADRRRQIVAVVALVGLPVMAGGLYLKLGSPALPPQPLAARLESRPDQSDVAILVRKVEAHLEANPEDGRGYEVLAPIYARIGRTADAARAWTSAIRLLGPSAVRENGLGEALTAEAGGVVTVEAKAAFEAAAVADPRDPKARYFLGLAAEQDGRPADAAQIWGALAASSPPDAPWMGLLRAALARVGAPVAAAPGPSAADVAAAQDMTPAERDQMVRGMVARLEARLAQDGSDIEGWLRLMRARIVLGEADKAKAAASEARAHFATDGGALGRIDALARELGLGS
ncbi:c-type cytochrome biogenesis protein CcmI [Ancylobacter amanitiformis]|uniref:Cytochrome c-type biogenesis protein CcmH n=1 Tax=Ancylobacter amanitiformis TaxID=217069 RepID=A0ABU0LM37_9HYPH|nr:c-type cytochrome biogenesis protein CcmI [Ancylobacter amanitiformis]MDQ0509764.1 cytochrome c-type biogenesis protein CcmH [Ancylobacter amanitiformis]